MKVIGWRSILFTSIFLGTLIFLSTRAINDEKQWIEALIGFGLPTLWFVLGGWKIIVVKSDTLTVYSLLNLIVGGRKIKLRQVEKVFIGIRATFRAVNFIGHGGNVIQISVSFLGMDIRSLEKVLKAKGIDVT